MCSDRCKNHGCRQKIPEGTSSAMYGVRAIAKFCEFKRCTSTRFDVTRVTQVQYYVTINTGVFPGKMCSDRRKKRGCGQKNQKALALLGLVSGPLPNAVNSSVVLIEFASRTDNKDEVLEGKFVLELFAFHQKDN